MDGPLGCSRMATMPTPSIVAVEGRVEREADSQVLWAPLASL